MPRHGDQTFREGEAPAEPRGALDGALERTCHAEVAETNNYTASRPTINDWDI
jgi:hypothetical protein